MSILTLTNKFQFIPDPAFPRYSAYSLGPSSGSMYRMISASLGGTNLPGFFVWSYDFGPTITTAPISNVTVSATLYTVPSGSYSAIATLEYSVDGGNTFFGVASGSPLAPLTPTTFTLDITSNFLAAGADLSKVRILAANGSSVVIDPVTPPWEYHILSVGLTGITISGTCLAPLVKTLPVVVPGQNFAPFPTPTQGPTWNVKKTSEFSNIKQQSTSGKVYVTNQRSAGLWKFEFKFEVLSDDPAKHNQYFTVPVAATDLASLESFYASVEGSGKFAYQPPDHYRGGTYAITSVTVLTDGYAILTTNTSLVSMKLGDKLVGSGFGTASYLNGKTGTVINANYQAKTFILAISTSGTHPLTVGSGTFVGGQPLQNPDANNRLELVNTVGSYSPLLVSSSVTQVVEPVQLIDTVSCKSNDLVIYDSTGASIPYTFLNTTTFGTGIMVDKTKQQYPPYEGIVIQLTPPYVQPVYAAYSYYYLCRFSEDTQEYENFMATLYALSALKIEQVRH